MNGLLSNDIYLCIRIHNTRITRIDTNTERTVSANIFIAIVAVAVVAVVPVVHQHDTRGTVDVLCFVVFFVVVFLCFFWLFFLFFCCFGCAPDQSPALAFWSMFGFGCGALFGAARDATPLWKPPLAVACVFKRCFVIGGSVMVLIVKALVVFVPLLIIYV